MRVIAGLVVSLFLGQAGGGAVGGDALVRAGRFAEACDAYEAVLRVSPEDLAAREGEVTASERLALQERAAGKSDDALKALLQAASYVPDNLKLLYDLGILEDQMGLYVDADQALTRLEALEGKSESAEVLFAVGRVKLDLGQLDAAEEKMTAYLKLRPEDASGHFGLGRVYRMQLDFGRAEAEFHKSIELQPKQTEGYYELGDAELQRNDFAAARVAFGKVLERNPRHGGALVGLGILEFKDKSYAKAAEVLRRAVAAEPQYPPGHYYLGLTLGRLGRAEESERELAVASRLAEEEKRRRSNRLVMTP